MKQFLPPGIKISTFRNPDGVFVQCRVLPLIADLDAIRPIAGFLSHSANFFCSFCLIEAENIDDFNYESWTYRDGTTVRAQAQNWLKEKTIKAKTALEAKNGVRWASFHDLPYWDPVKHVVLGLMHNTIQGVLGHHLRVLWGIGRQAAKQKVADDLENEERFSESDASEASEDLLELPEDFTSDNEDTMDVDNESGANSSANSGDESESSTTPTPGGLSFEHLMFDDNESDDGDFHPLDYSGAGVFNMSTAQLDIIRDCIRTVELPSWVARPPTNLGEASHGKLKAQELLTLFTGGELVTVLMRLPSHHLRLTVVLITPAVAPGTPLVHSDTAKTLVAFTPAGGVPRWQLEDDRRTRVVIRDDPAITDCDRKSWRRRRRSPSGPPGSSLDCECYSLCITCTQFSLGRHADQLPLGTDPDCVGASGASRIVLYHTQSVTTFLSMYIKNMKFGSVSYTREQQGSAEGFCGPLLFSGAGQATSIQSDGAGQGARSSRDPHRIRIRYTYYYDLRVRGARKNGEEERREGARKGRETEASRSMMKKTGEGRKRAKRGRDGQKHEGRQWTEGGRGGAEQQSSSEGHGRRAGGRGRGEGAKNEHAVASTTTNSTGSRSTNAAHRSRIGM
ncbi:hypothetical protein B0H11DRAFT_1927839 [Mycena galericulata]|nr:hypothetical protein B0H11DRAFT_1927839 [Mycena galericulata]